MERRRRENGRTGRVEIARRASARRRSCSNHGDTANQRAWMVQRLTARVAVVCLGNDDEVEPHADDAEINDRYPSITCL
jgi:hypothetical protein